jgi:hypothetical protein
MWPINLQECEGPTNMGDWGPGFPLCWEEPLMLTELTSTTDQF